jgi:hypothetical protein
MQRLTRSQFMLVIAMAAASLAARAVFLDARAIWFDEASSWLTAQMSAHELLASLRASTHVPLYYPLLSSWASVFGNSPVALRSFSVLFGLLTVFGCGVIGRQLHQCFTDRADEEQVVWFGLFVAALVGLSAFQVHCSVEARMYSLGTFLTVCTTACALRLRERPDSRATWFWLGVTTIASVYTHHLLVVTAAVQAAWLWWMPQENPDGEDGQSPCLWKARRYWVITTTTVILLWLPALWLWWQQFHRVRSGFWIQPMSLWTLPQTCLEFVASPPPGRWWEFREIGIPAALCFAWVLVDSWRRRDAHIRLLVLQSVVPVFVIGLVSLSTPLWEARYFRFAHVTLMILVANWLWEISPEQKHRIGIVTSSLLLSLVGVACFWGWRDIPHCQAMRGAMIEIENQTGVSRLVLVRSPLDFVVAKYYGSRPSAEGLQVRFWPQNADGPGEASHLITVTDYYHVADFRDVTEAWVIEPAHAQLSVLQTISDETAVYESDSSLEAWSVRLGRIPLECTQN